MYWVYKCNSKDREYQRTYGDWSEVFETKEAQWWGTTKIVPELSKARVGDTILAYQTDRNELVGTARVVRWEPHGKFKRLILRPMRTIGVRVRPLKKRVPRVRRIPALQPGPIHTLYRISNADAIALLHAANVHINRAAQTSEDDLERMTKGGGFGTPEQNKHVEMAAVRYVVRHYRDRDWSVKDVSTKNEGYDLLCKKSGQVRHVEVKGARGDSQQFIITTKELRAWKTDSRYILAFVTNATSAKPSVSFFPRESSRNEFQISPLSFIARRRM